MAAMASQGNVGSASTKAAGSTQSLTCARAVAVGELVSVFIGTLALASAGDPTVTDSKGNTYIKLGTSTRAGTTRIDEWIYVGYITTALTTSDTVSADWLGTSSSVRLLSAWGYTAASANVHAAFASAGGSSAIPSVATGGTITLPAVLVLGTIAVNGPTGEVFTQDTDTNGGTAFQTATRVGTTGGNASTNFTLNSTYKITTSTFNPQTWNPSLGTSEPWTEGVVALSPKVSVPPEGRSRRYALLRR